MIRDFQSTRDLMSDLIGSSKLNESMLRKVNQFKDLLDRMLMLDHTKRISLNEALQHPFITERMSSGQSKNDQTT